MKKLLFRLFPLVYVEEGCLLITYLKIFGFKILVRVRSRPRYISEMICSALEMISDVRNVKPARGKLRMLQLVDLKILHLLDLLFRKYGIPYYLGGGTLLGAVRHKGFVPWDDDLDVCIPKHLRDKVQEVLEKELANTNLQLWGVDKAWGDATLRVSHRNCRSVNVDIFYSYCFDLGEADRERVKKAWTMAHENYRTRFNAIEGKENREMLIRFRKSADEYYKSLLPEMVDFFDPNARYLTTEIHWKDFRYIPMTDILPFSQVEFEGHFWPAPHNPEAYLLTHYKDMYSFPKHLDHHQDLFMQFDESTLMAISSELDQIIERFGHE